MPPQYRKKQKALPQPTPGWAVYLRTSSDENQKPELSRARQRFAIENNVLNKSDIPVYTEYIDVLTGKTPHRDGYQRMLEDARQGKFSHVIVERADRFGRNDTEALRAIDELDELGIKVVFANQPDLDPMGPDDRVIVALSFTLARRESALLGIRVKGGLQAKRKSGGFCGRAPDGYRNVEARTSPEMKKDLGRFNHWIEQDPERAAVWRCAWDLLLEDKLTLEEIAEALHTKGYRRQSGQPFVEVQANGERRPNKSTLSNTFHNWAYAGWVVSEVNGIAPKTLQGNWEPIVTTEEFERGLDILARRNEKRVVRRKHDYLLKGIIYYELPHDGKLVKLTGSRPNASRPSGGTPYYCVPRSNINLLCSVIDEKVAKEIAKIQIDPDLLPLVRQGYKQDLAQHFGHLPSNEREQIQKALKEVDTEEQRMARLFASGKITEDIWDGLWREWQERRRVLRESLEGLNQKREVHIDNLETALQIIAKVGLLYNNLERGDQKELLRYMIERVIVDSEEKVRLKLHPPFAYLRDITEQVREDGKTKTSGGSATGSDWVKLCWGTWTRTKNDRARTCCFAN